MLTFRCFGGVNSFEFQNFWQEPPAKISARYLGVLSPLSTSLENTALINRSLEALLLCFVKTQRLEHEMSVGI